MHQRTQYIKIEDIRSNTETIVCGTPQGSTLGPLLFLLYVNDLPNSSSRFSFRIFADDTNIFFSSSCLNELESVANNELALVLRYCASNKLSVNFKETNYMLTRFFTTVALCRCLGFTSLVPDFLSQGHWVTKTKLTNSQKITVLSKLRNFCAFLLSIKHRLCWAFLPNLVYDYVYGFMSNRELNHATFLSHGRQREFNLVSCFPI